MKRVLILISVLLMMVGPVEDLDFVFNRDHIYGKLGVICEIDYDEDLVSVFDWNGTVWSFYGAEDYCLGDYVDMVFHDNLTPEIYDDVIIRVTYERVDLVQAQILNSIMNLY